MPYHQKRHSSRSRSSSRSHDSPTSHSSRFSRTIASNATPYTSPATSNTTDSPSYSSSSNKYEFLVSKAYDRDSPTTRRSHGSSDLRSEYYNSAFLAPPPHRSYGEVRRGQAVYREVHPRRYQPQTAVLDSVDECEQKSEMHTSVASGEAQDNQRCGVDGSVNGNGDRARSVALHEGGSVAAPREVDRNVSDHRLGSPFEYRMATTVPMLNRARPLEVGQDRMKEILPQRNVDAQITRGVKGSKNFSWR